MKLPLLGLGGEMSLEKGGEMDRRRRPTAPEVAATWLIVACAVILTSTVLWREFGASSVGTTRIAQAGLQAGSSVDDWEQFAEGGISLGSADAPVTIIEFADFKCGFCRDLAPILKEVRSEYGARIRLIYRHFPGAKWSSRSGGRRDGR